jgi:formate dehydrogenase assembly factor FdhD
MVIIMIRKDCPYSIFIEIISQTGKTMFRFEEHESNLIMGFVTAEKYIQRSVRATSQACSISMYIKDKGKQKIFETKRENTQLLNCINPAIAFSEVKLGIRYRRISPTFKSFQRSIPNLYIKADSYKVSEAAVGSQGVK